MDKGAVITRLWQSLYFYAISGNCLDDRNIINICIKTKEDLVKVALCGLIDDAYILKTVKETKGTIIDKIAACITAYADYMENEIGWDFNYLWAQMILNSGEGKNIRLQKDLDLVMSLFEEGVKNGELIEADYTNIGKMIINYIYGAAFTADLDKENMHITDTTDMFCKTVNLLLKQYMK